MESSKIKNVHSEGWFLLSILFFKCVQLREFGGEHKMKLIFSNSSGFVLVQKIKYTRKKGEKKSTLGVTAWFTSRRFTPMRPWLTRHLTRSLFGVELVEDENRKIKYAEGFFMSYSFKCHYKQLFGGMFDGSFHVEVCLQVV